jgi:hypothetical protein
MIVEHIEPEETAMLAGDCTNRLEVPACSAIEFCKLADGPGPVRLSPSPSPRQALRGR